LGGFRISFLVFSGFTEFVRGASANRLILSVPSVLVALRFRDGLSFVTITSDWKEDTLKPFKIAQPCSYLVVQSGL
jgi:hypothetical protein